jgi:hypothetical protein
VVFLLVGVQVGEGSHQHNVTQEYSLRAWFRRCCPYVTTAAADENAARIIRPMLLQVKPW